MHDGKPVGAVKRIVPRYPLGPGIPVYDAEGVELEGDEPAAGVENALVAAVEGT